jgi:hypothetical protein
MDTNGYKSIFLRYYMYPGTYTGACYILPKGKRVSAFRGSQKGVIYILDRDIFRKR